MEQTRSESCDLLKSQRFSIVSTTW